MIRINKAEMQMLRKQNLGKFIHSTTGHHKNWYVVEAYPVLKALSKLPQKTK